MSDWNQVKEGQQLINDRTKAWAQGHNEGLKQIEQNGKLGIWDQLKNWPVNTYNDLKVQMAEPNLGWGSHDSREETRQQLLDQATKRAQDVYAANQQNLQRQQQGQPPLPTPTPVSAWEYMNQTGEVTR